MTKNMTIDDSCYPNKYGEAQYFVDLGCMEEAIVFRLNVIRAALNVLEKNPEGKFLFPRDVMQKRLLEGYAKANEYFCINGDLASALLVLESVWDDVGYVGSFLRGQDVSKLEEQQ